jgi:DNA replication and repair protein RecF
MHTNLKPVLLLDDIFDKLDNERVEKLIRLVTADYFGQVIVSDTDERRMVELFQSLKIEKKLFRVEEAQITEINL